MPETDAITVIPLETPTLGDRSYLVHDGEVAFVVDPQRDIDRVLALLDEQGLRLTHVFESHIHNDYVTGGFALAQRAGAAYLVNADDAVSFERTPVRDGDVLEIGPRMRVTAVATPGHTFTHLLRPRAAGWPERLARVLRAHGSRQLGRAVRARPVPARRGRPCRRPAPHLSFGAVAIGGAAAGAKASGLVTGPVLLAAFAALLVVVAGVMAARQLRSRHGRPGAHHETRVDDPIITFRPSFGRHCPRALKVLVTATLVGLLTGSSALAAASSSCPRWSWRSGCRWRTPSARPWWSSRSPRPRRSRSARAAAFTRAGAWWRCSPLWPLSAAGRVPG